MKSLFIESLTPESGRVVEFFQLTQVDYKAKKDGAPYLALTLGDRTGTCGGKLWDVPEGAFKAGQFVKIEADCSSYRDVLQLTIKRLRIAGPEEIDKNDFIPASKRDRKELLGEVVERLAQINDGPLRTCIMGIVDEYEAKLLEAPAAKKMHQAYLGGLCEHILNLFGLVEGVCNVYPELNRDLLYAACFIHDIGKIEEYCYDTHIGYTRSGLLLGHIIQGSIVFARASDGLDPVTRDHVAHIIASHHGTLEWGAARVPMTREARMFHLIDMIDSQMGIMDNAFGTVGEDGFTTYNNALGAALWNGR